MRSRGIGGPRSGLAVAGLLLAVACAGTPAIGPLEIDPPEGWQVTRVGATSMQIADGTAGAGAEAGSATAVFDIILNSPHTPDTYREMLAEHNVGAREERLTLDGYEAVGFEYTGEAFAGSQYAVVIPDYEIHILYRAAFRHDETAFRGNLSRVKQSIRSIRFTEPPPG